MTNKPNNQSAQTQLRDAKDKVAKKSNKTTFYQILNEGKTGEMPLVDVEYFIEQAMLEYSSSQLEAKDKEIERLNNMWDCDKACLKEFSRKLEASEMLNEKLKSQLSQATTQSKSVNPPAQEVDVEKLVNDVFKTKMITKATCYTDNGSFYIDGLKALMIYTINEYQALQSKAVGYSLEEVKTAIDMARDGMFMANETVLGLEVYKEWEYTPEQIIQSLTPTPIQTKGREVECPNKCHKGITKPSKDAICYQCGKPW